MRPILPRVPPGPLRCTVFPCAWGEPPKGKTKSFEGLCVLGPRRTPRTCDKQKADDRMVLLASGCLGLVVELQEELLKFRPGFHSPPSSPQVSTRCFRIQRPNLARAGVTGFPFQSCNLLVVSTVGGFKKLETLKRSRQLRKEKRRASLRLLTG